MDNGKDKRITNRIKVYGIVQGVGFRPLVYRIAKILGISGTVRNVGGYVEIIIETNQEEMELFLTMLQNDDQNSDQNSDQNNDQSVDQSGNLSGNLSGGHSGGQNAVQNAELSARQSGCEIVKIEIEEIPHIIFDKFTILGSGESDEISILPPDLPVCSQCQKELYSEKNRRFLNPFISCMACGPRYTIIDELPYDRQNTTMLDFEMCPACKEEYKSPEHRRFHAQTISCDDCGPYLIFRPSSVIKQATTEIIVKTQMRQTTTDIIGKAQTRQATTEIIGSVQKQQEPNNVIVGKQKEQEKTNIIVKVQKEQESLAFLDFNTELHNQEALTTAISVLKSGGILAVKGIGGYHLVCSPFMEDTVQKLRRFKGREEKPFAVMFGGIQQIEEYCEISEIEQALLETKARPIVLLNLKNDTMSPSTNKGSMYCGAFLPYTPLQILLIGECGPLIMTSANLSGQPIIKEDEAMLAIQSPYLDGVLYNTRRIMRSVDDSVAKVIDGKPQLIRRSRGYVPYPVFLEQEHRNSIEYHHINTISNDKTSSLNTTIFAAGGDLKAAFCFYKAGKAVVSQYFGDLEEETVMEEYKKSFTDLSTLLKLTPALAVCDLHPKYYSSDFAKSLGIPILQVQHHHAHIASVIAEHDLKERVIGVAFDGTGYGTDGNIWGGEFLICEGAEFIRAAQLNYVPMFGGDDSMRDARKTASCYLLEAGLEEQVRDDRIATIKSAINHKINTFLNSSVGRLFDAVASILNLGQTNRYEGECASQLEREAVLAQKKGKKPIQLSFAFIEEHEIIKIDTKPLLEALCKLRDTEDIGALALGFHYALTEAIVKICEKLSEKYRTKTVALSGGVFQNTVLSELTLKELRNAGFQVYVNLAVPPNDGGISLGQTYLGLQSNIFLK